MGKPEKPPIENPIISSAGDVLGRASVAHDFAKGIRRLDASEGVVVGVMGPWGFGKSSFINLMKEEFERDPALTVIDFNPWMFSGSQQLVDFFFKEVAAELRLKGKDRFKTIADGLDKYGDLLSPLGLIPVFGSWWDRSFKAFKTATSAYGDRRQGSQPIRDKVAEALRDLDEPVVVVIDDIDRLTTDEIRDIFKLVRLTASFPNLIYLLAFDRERVELALDETNVPGRAYLEKIIQLGFDLPAIPDEVLTRQVFAELDEVLGGLENLRFDQNRWADVYFEIIEPLVSSLRDVARLALSARPTLEALGGEIEVVDLLALEALRTFRPQIFGFLPHMRMALTKPDSSYGSNDNPAARAQVEALVSAADDDAEVARNAIRRIFPAARRYIENYSYGSDSSAGWRRDHRVAHIDFANLYFDRIAPSELVAFRRAETAFVLLNNANGLAELLDATNPEELEDTIRALEVYQDQYPVDGIVPGAINLLNRIADIPKRSPRGFLDIITPDMSVWRVVIRLLRTLDDEADRERAVRDIFAGVDTYSSKLMLANSLRRSKDESQSLVSESAASELQNAVVDEVRAGQPAAPSKEWDLLRVYAFAANRLSDEYQPPSLGSPDAVRALFKSAMTMHRSQSMGSRAMQSTNVLAWETLIVVLGSEDAIRKSVELLRGNEADQDLVQLVEKYLGGWRPSKSGELEE